MRLIGITGSIACGKSTVSRELLRLGYPVIDGDSLARELTGPDGLAMRSVRAAFGDRYILPDGSLNRREMGRLVFSDPVARDRLDQVMAPYLQALTLERIESVRVSGACLCFLDMPLLYEKGYDQYCDTVWCVWLPEDLQLKRLIARDGYSRGEALSRIRAVMSSDEKADRSAVVIDNSGSMEDTLLQVSSQLQTELRRAQSVPRRRRTAQEPSPASAPEPVAQQPLPPQDRITVPFIERPESSRRKAPSRKASWTMPSWIRILLICLSVVLAVSFTAQMLMQAYLARRQETHAAEQKAIDEQYPLSYRDLIVKISGEYNLSPSLTAAVIRNESSFRPSVESSVGARGLMQLMPDTSEWIAQKLRWKDYHFDRLYDPETNIRFGCWYLNYLSSLFDGDPLCVVCAYHAGQGEIRSWLSNPLYSSDGTTLIRDNLPDGPTKQYAGRVTRDYGIYQAKYFHPDDLSSSAGTDTASR
jgi:dephospho-CoA kinase